MPTGNTQQVINYGASANDGQGDPLRTAFIKTDENFDNIWLAGPAGSNVRITDNTISAIDTNGNLILSPNGVGVIQTNNTLVPRANRSYDLGSADLQYRAVYANTATFQTLSLPGDLSVGGNLTVQGNIIQVGNIVTETLTIQLANAATTGNAANGSGITVGASDNIATLLYNSASNVWTTNIGANISGNVTAPYFIGNGSQLTGITSYANANAVAYGQAGWAGNIIPSGNAVYSLGNATNQWNDLYVSNATIYMNNVPLSMTAGNVLTVNGEPVLSNDSNTAITTTGNITANYFIGDGSRLTGISTGNVTFSDQIVIGTGTNDGGGGLYLAPGNASIANSSVQYLRVRGGDAPTHIHFDTGNNAYYDQYFGDDGKYVKLEATGNIVINANQDGGPSAQWNYSYDGNLTLPTNGDINFEGGGITQTINDDLNIVVQDEEDDGWSLYNTITDSVGNNLSQTQLDSSSFTIRTDMTGASHQWQFDGNTLQVSKDSIVRGFESNVVVQSMAGANAVMASLQSVSNVNDPNVFSTFDATTTSANIKVYNGGSNGGTGYTWQFNNTGNLTLPRGGIVYETNIPSGGLEGNTIALKPSGGTSTDQQLLVYPTVTVDANHLHLTTGNLYNTELFLGNDNLYVKLANTGNVVINSNDDNGNTAQWTFSNTGSTQFPNSTITDPGTVNQINLNDSSGIKISTFDTNDIVIETDVDGGDGGTWTFYNDGRFGPGLEGQDNDSIYLTGRGATGSSYLRWNNNQANVALPSDTYITAGNGVANISILNSGVGGFTQSWAFDATGNLTLPGNIFAVNYANGTAVSFGGNYGNSNVATFLAAFGSNTISTTGNITAGNIIGNISITGNVTGTSANVTLVAGAYSWTFDNTGNTQGDLSLTGANITINNAPGGNEGAEIKWALPSAANTVLSGTVVQDVFQNGMRFFEAGGNSRGLYMDLGNVPNGAGTAVGYRDIPQVSFAGNATLAATDAGRHYYSTLATANTLTIANNTSVSWTVGTAISVVNRGSGNITIAQGSGVSLYLAGNSTAANRTLSTYGMATLLNVAANVWMINGTGVS